MRDYCDLMSVQGDPWWRREGLDNEDVIELLTAQRTLNFSPGEDHIYSNSNYTLITELVAKASGVSFDEYADNFFAEMGMNNTSYTTNYMDVVENLAAPYSNWGGPKWKLYPMITDLHGDGFLNTTLFDQLKWEIKLQSQSQDPLLLTSQQPMEYSDYKAYGYGLEIDNYKGNRRIHHADGTGSYGSEAMRFPDDGLSIVVMSNSGSLWASGIAADLADHFLNVPEDAQTYPTRPEKLLEKPALSEIVGTYELPDRTIMNIVVKNDSLYREIEGRDPSLLVVVEGNLFQYKNNPNLNIAFVPNQLGSYDFLLYHPQVEERRGRRLSEIVNASPESLNGLYTCDELDVTMGVEHLSDNSYRVSVWDREYDVELLEEDLMRFYGYTIKFDRDSSGKVKQLLLDYNRIQGVTFLPGR